MNGMGRTDAVTIAAGTMLREVDDPQNVVKFAVDTAAHFTVLRRVRVKEVTNPYTNAVRTVPTTQHIAAYRIEEGPMKGRYFEIVPTDWNK